MWMPRCARKSTIAGRGAGGDGQAALVEAVGERRDRQARHDADRHAERGVEADLGRGQAPVGEPERPERQLHAGGHEERRVEGGGVQAGAGEEARQLRARIRRRAGSGPDRRGGSCAARRRARRGPRPRRGRRCAPSLRRRRPRRRRRASRRARRYSRRPARFRFSNAAGRVRPRGTDQGAPARRKSAGGRRRGCRRRRRPGCRAGRRPAGRSQRPSASGRPGFTAMRQVVERAAGLRSAATWSSSPAEAPPEVRIASASAPRSSAAATASAESARVAEVDRGCISQRRRISSEHRAVGVVGLVRRGGAAGRADLVAGGEHRDPEAAADRRARRGRRRRRARGPAAPRRRPSGRISAPAATSSPAARVLAPGRGDRSKAMASPSRATCSSRTTVSTPAGQERAGQDAQRLAGRHRGPRCGAPAAARPDASGRRCGGGAEARVGEAVAVDGGVGGGRVGAAGADSRRQDAAAGVGERHGLDGGDGRHARGEAGERGVGRHPVDAGRQGEAIVAGRAHRRPTRVRMKSAIAGTSSRSKTGTARPASGTSEATASTVSSPAAMRSCAVAARRTSIFGWRSRL